MHKQHPAFECGDDLLDAIGKKNTQTLVELSKHRDQLIFADNQIDEASLIALLAQNEEIRAALLDQQSTLLTKSSEVAQGKSAHQAYETNRV